MASRARASFDKNAEDIQQLLNLHSLKGGTNRGRRHGLEVLNKSGIVLLSAFWEAYCEDIASEALDHLIKHLKDPQMLPEALRKVVAKQLKAEPHDLAVWQVSGDGWKSYLRSRFDSMKEQRDRQLNTPKTNQIITLFREFVGIEDISKNWNLTRNMTVKRACSKLDDMVTLRGAIAHRGTGTASVTKAQVTDYFDFIKKLVAKTGGTVNTHVKVATGRPLWLR